MSDSCSRQRRKGGLSVFEDRCGNILTTSHTGIEFGSI